jgi:hypothetical protein
MRCAVDEETAKVGLKPAIVVSEDIELEFVEQRDTPPFAVAGDVTSEKI